MSRKTIAPYGSWKSPITAALIASGHLKLGDPHVDGGDIYWMETRPEEGGRAVIVRRTPDGAVEDVNPPPFNARTRVHEYGGGDYLVDRGVVYFSNFADQRVYRARSGGAPEPLTPEGAMRFADGVIDRDRGRLVCIHEDHTNPEHEPVNTVVALSTESGEPLVLASGNDFYAAPRISPDGGRLAWLTWNHPNMPWDGTELWVADLDERGGVRSQACVAGGSAESILQPEWSADGTLHFISDRTGWWNLYRIRAGEVEGLCPMDAEFGGPQWVFGLSYYAFAADGRIVSVYERDGRSHLLLIDSETLACEPLDLPYTRLGGVRTATGAAVLAAGAPAEPTAIVSLDLSTRAITVLKRSSDRPVDPGYLSMPESITFPTGDGRTAHAIHYPPCNCDCTGPGGERPPLLVMSHGGPTAASHSAYNPAIQYWTSRGIAVVDVNYGGSTGYGRAYRERLHGRWGIVDVEDCVNAARHLVECGAADPDRLIVRGGSAGGYTTLCCLAFTDAFKAGASYYGVSDLEILARETHKFESRYLDRLVGTYPEHRDTYRKRSPIDHVDSFSCALILFQGLEDEVVPPNQSQRIFEAVGAKGLPVAYVAFPGEQHGFRQSANIRRALEAELDFYARVLGFEPADAVEPVQIENL